LPALFYIAGLAAILFAHFEDFSHGLPVHSEHRHSGLTTALSVAGGLCFVMFHVLNLRMQHSSDCTCPIHADPGHPAKGAPKAS
jgi:hypothetical protein